MNRTSAFLFMFLVNRTSTVGNGIHYADYLLWKINSMVKDIMCSWNVRLNHFLNQSLVKKSPVRFMYVQDCVADFQEFCRHFADCAFIFTFYNGNKKCTLLNVEFFRICTHSFELCRNVYCLSLSVTHLNINIRI